MSGLIIEAVGLTAACLTTGSFIPQVYRVWRTQDTAAISTGMYVMFMFGTAAWLIYGVEIYSPAVILANAVTFLLAGAVLALKLKYPVRPLDPIL